MLTSSNVSPFILGFDGTEITDDLRRTLETVRPAGFIIFGRNIESPDQLKKLCAELKTLSPLKYPLIFIDQEGGRVRRIRWQEVYQAPPARTFGEIYEKDPQKGLQAAQWSAYLTAREMHASGITANCMPVADLIVDGAHSIIGDRAYSSDPAAVSALCAAAIKGCMAGGVWPVIKHAPGHGRAKADSHEKLPEVAASAQLLENDLMPFKANNQCPFVMTAHVKYPALDDLCATNSEKILNGVLRKQCGMTGTIIADDMFMRALEGDLEARIQNALGAGCDLVICGSSSIDGSFNADMWQQVAALAGKFSLTTEARQRLETLPTLPQKFSIGLDEAKQELEEAMAA